MYIILFYSSSVSNLYKIMAHPDQINTILCLFRIKYIYIYIYYSSSGSNIYEYKCIALLNQIYTEILTNQVQIYTIFCSSGSNMYYCVALLDQIYTFLWLFRIKYIVFLWLFRSKYKINYDSSRLNIFYLIAFLV